MNNDNENIVVKVIEGIVSTLAKSAVSIFDGLRAGIEHANPSLFALIATLLPFVLPLPVAFMSAHSAMKFFGWESWAANVLGYGLEGLGLLCWVKLVDAVLVWMNNEGKARVITLVIVYGLVALVYELVLLFINVVLAQKDGADWRYTLVLALVCLLPALSATVYGYEKRNVELKLAQEKAETAAQKEKERQERREDRKALQVLKLQHAADTKLVELDENKPPFRKGGKQ